MNEKEKLHEADNNKSNNAETENIKPETEKTDNDKKKVKLKELESELNKANRELSDAVSQYQELNDRYVRMLAEYDNFRRRSAKEHESIYADAYCDAIKEILPVLDNLERAAQYNEVDTVQKGIQMTLKQMNDMLEKMGISEIKAKYFDPEFHNAIMHIEDDNYGENEIVDVLQKGYIKGDKIIRYAMVKVAN